MSGVTEQVSKLVCSIEELASPFYLNGRRNLYQSDDGRVIESKELKRREIE